ncbi:MAG: bifunctional nuclease family protein, partial [Candidatus Aenigmarchaeota archaeon]|nr:bifunctional nuclease family protein [Candidatus Aenigmarchaeota archaeon]
DQARSIRLGKEGRIDVRPTTHDLYVETLRSFNITVENAAVVRFDSDIYYGELVLRSADRVLRLDSRPTDAIAVALRAGVPVMLNRTMLEQQGQTIC